jgi:hypothetical protein
MAENEKSSLSNKIQEGASEGVKRAVATIVHYKIVGLVAVGTVGAFFYFNVPGMIAGYVWDKTAGAAVDATGEVIADAKDATFEGARSLFDSAAGAVTSFKDEWNRPEPFILEMENFSAPEINDTVSDIYIPTTDADITIEMRTAPKLFAEAAAPNLVIGDGIEISNEPQPGMFDKAIGGIKSHIPKFDW